MQQVEVGIGSLNSWQEKVRVLLDATLKTDPGTVFWGSDEFDAGLCEGFLNGFKCLDISIWNTIGRFQSDDGCEAHSSQLCKIRNCNPK